MNVFVEFAIRLVTQSQTVEKMEYLTVGKHFTTIFFSGAITSIAIRGVVCRARNVRSVAADHVSTNPAGRNVANFATYLRVKNPARGVYPAVIYAWVSAETRALLCVGSAMQSNWPRNSLVAKLRKMLDLSF